MAKEKEPETPPEPPKPAKGKENIIEFEPPAPDKAMAYFQKLEQKIDKVIEKLFPPDPPPPEVKSNWQKFWEFES